MKRLMLSIAVILGLNISVARPAIALEPTLAALEVADTAAALRLIAHTMELQFRTLFPAGSFYHHFIKNHPGGPARAIHELVRANLPLRNGIVNLIGEIVGIDKKAKGAKLLSHLGDPRTWIKLGEHCALHDTSGAGVLGRTGQEGVRPDDQAVGPRPSDAACRMISRNVYVVGAIAVGLSVGYISYKISEKTLDHIDFFARRADAEAYARLLTLLVTRLDEGKVTLCAGQSFPEAASLLQRNLKRGPGKPPFRGVACKPQVSKKENCHFYTGDMFIATPDTEFNVVKSIELSRFSERRHYYTMAKPIDKNDSFPPDYDYNVHIKRARAYIDTIIRDGRDGIKFKFGIRGNIGAMCNYIERECIVKKTGLDKLWGKHCNW